MIRAVRPVETRDLDGVVALAESLGPGMTTLPADRTSLGEKIERSVASFAGRADRADAQYLLVLEDENGAVLGTSALYAQVGAPYGFFSYKRLRLVQRSQAVDVSCNVEMLAVANDYTGTTEVGTLAIHPALKGTGAGRLLARARYMLVAIRPDLFAPLLIGEMRGWQDEAGENPFWNAVGARFFSMDFATADRLSATRGADFIADLLPKHPIYIELLPEAARDVIGKPHRNSLPAMMLLKSEGFRYEGYVDVFDVGPQMHCDRDHIATVARSRRGTVAALSPNAAPVASSQLVCTEELDRFRVVMTSGLTSDGEIALGDDAVRALGTDRGAELRWSPGVLDVAA
ncbi:MAG: astA [Sphingomonas bacterium]|uniref:arginine N-succinyltransferase n=1 Tax=Sphingomonas bacterium TaxID=1895847 RepID=UPI002603BFDC|nr:arginine N-succinyltransferase [Sphingomonas bacterium]MDB5707336.1 astA [Sphingomonas bacterium]